MDRSEPHDPQRSELPPVAAELEAAGFEKAEQIGRGGFGVVYRCNQPNLHRTVAVKVLATDLDEENRERFYREQQAMAQLTEHPNVAPSWRSAPRPVASPTSSCPTTRRAPSTCESGNTDAYHSTNCSGSG